MIPRQLVDFVHGPVLGWIGGRDERLRPLAAWTFGARVEAAADTITVFLPDCEGGPLLAKLAADGTIAITVADGISHESYQFKGKLIETRPTTEEERAVQDILRSKLITYMAMFPEALFQGYTLYPSTAVSIRVAEVFNQTPGPGAGRLVDLSELAD